MHRAMHLMIHGAKRYVRHCHPSWDWSKQFWRLKTRENLRPFGTATGNRTTRRNRFKLKSSWNCELLYLSWILNLIHVTDLISVDSHLSRDLSPTENGKFWWDKTWWRERWRRDTNDPSICMIRYLLFTPLIVMNHHRIKEQLQEDWCCCDPCFRSSFKLKTSFRSGRMKIALIFFCLITVGFAVCHKSDYFLMISVIVSFAAVMMTVSHKTFVATEPAYLHHLLDLLVAVLFVESKSDPIRSSHHFLSFF